MKWNLMKLFGRKLFFDTIKKHKKTGFYPFSRKYIFGKNHRGGSNWEIQILSIVLKMYSDISLLVEILTGFLVAFWYL